MREEKVVVEDGTPWLDGKHAVFGKVTEGMYLVRSIGGAATGPGDRPLQDVVMDPVKVKGVEGS